MKDKIINIGLRVLSTPIGNGFFSLTKPIFQNNKTSRLGNAWWYVYLYHFACRLDLEKIKTNNKGYRVVRKLQSDFDYFHAYNTVFHLDCVSHIIYELSQGYIPVIDDREHVWDQFFEQPIKLEGIEIGDLTALPESDEHSTLHTPVMIPNSKPMRKLWTRLLRVFCRLKDNEKSYIETEIKDLLDGHRVLAIVCRGTDYIGTGMPIQPKVEDVINEAREWMKMYNYDRIYLATEAESIYEQFAEAFPGQLLVNKRSYYDKAMTEQNVKWIGLVKFDRENDNYLRGLEYLSSICILSKCDALLAGFCGASNMALLFNDEKYERFKVYDFG